jgi:type IV secretory pathway VirB9-like protein
MKICRNLFHLITPLACIAVAAAQADLAPGRILNLNLDPQSVTTLQLRPGFVTSVRLPEAVSSVVLGDPAAFKAEHSEAEPQLVFFKPSTTSVSRTNALITTRTGREVSVALVSRGNFERLSAGRLRPKI